MGAIRCCRRLGSDYLLSRLCDCFPEYGETTAEMALLFTFVLLGSSLIWSGFTVLDGQTLLFALIALLVRPLCSPGRSRCRCGSTARAWR